VLPADLDQNRRWGATTVVVDVADGGEPVEAGDECASGSSGG
jgi:hypothetical protein